MASLAPVLAAVAIGMLAGCAPALQQGGLGPVVRICNGGDCRDVPTDVAAQASPEARPTLIRQSDPDAYQGQSPAELQAQAEAGDARAAYLLGQVHEFGLGGKPRQPAVAARWYEVAAAAGMPWAQFRLAQLYENGGAGRRDPARAAELTRAAAQGGVAAAAYNLGMMYSSGKGVPRDGAEAVRWLTIAAEGGVPEAQYNLALILFRGDGVPRQLYPALTWMRAAAASGNAAAQKAVGRLYMTGLETMGQDLTEARSWLAPLAARGDRDAQAWVREIDRALADDRAYQQQLQLQAMQTQAMWTSIVLAAWLAPPPVTYVVRAW